MKVKGSVLGFSRDRDAKGPGVVLTVRLPLEERTFIDPGVASVMVELPDPKPQVDLSPKKEEKKDEPKK